MLYLFIVALPFAIAAIAPILHRLFGTRSGTILSVLSAGLTIWYATLFPSVISGNDIRISYPWIESLNIRFSLLIDGLSLLFLLLISGIGTLVTFYASGYLRDDPRLGRFYSYLYLFMGAMLGLVISDSMILLFIFWELTSLASFFLIGFDNQRLKARKSALQALLVTSAGGLALLAGIALLAQISGTFNFSQLDAQLIKNHELYPACLLLVAFSAFTKSAQMPFHFWLPNAMVAPTPVSAFLHSATMVKAGIYLLARLSPTMAGTEFWQDLLIPAGCITAVMAPLLALEQTDLKRLLAYSTIGTLGLLVLLLGIGSTDAINAAMTYLLIHSLYKGALFMVAGSVDHGAGTRDILGLCGLARSMPMTSLAAILAALSMAGFPPLFGFIGKELAYNASIDATNIGLVFGLTVFSNMVTVAIAFMVGFEPFMGKKLKSQIVPHEVSVRMWLGPMALALLGLFVGLFPQLIAEPLISRAADAVTGRVEQLSLKAWHGFNIVLAISALTLFGGTLLFWYRDLARRLAIRFTKVTKTGPSEVYELLLEGTLRIASRFTLATQNGSLSRYLMITFTTLLCALLTVLYSHSSAIGQFELSWSGWQETAISAVIIAAALSATFSRSPILGFTSIGVIGFSVSLIYTIYSAPDVAITQLLVETLSVVLGVFLIAKLPRLSSALSSIQKTTRTLIAVVFGLCMTAISAILLNTPVPNPASTFYKLNSYVEAHGKNTVNVILVDFRALDTLGEITVLAAAAVGVATMLLTTFRARKETT